MRVCAPGLGITPDGTLVVLLIDAENVSALSKVVSSITSKVMSTLAVVGPNCTVAVFPPGITGDMIMKSSGEVACGATG